MYMKQEREKKREREQEKRKTDTSSSCSLKQEPPILFTAIMTATMSFPFMMGVAITFLVSYSVSMSTKSLKWGH